MHEVLPHVAFLLYLAAGLGQTLPVCMEQKKTIRGEHKQEVQNVILYV